MKMITIIFSSSLISISMMGYLSSLGMYVSRAFDIREKYIEDSLNVSRRNPMNGDLLLSEHNIRQCLISDMINIAEWSKNPFYKKLYMSLPIESIKPKMIIHYD